MKIAIKRRKVLRILAEMNKSQNWLAHKMYTSSGYMSQLMSGVRNPSPRIRERLQRVLKVKNWKDIFKMKGKASG